MNHNAVFRVAKGPQAGYIYLINAVGTNKFKIGKTRFSISHRIDVLQTACPFRLRYVYHTYVQNMNRTERELHNQFSLFRSVGEWFALEHGNVQECISLMRLVQIEQPRIFVPSANEVKLEPEPVQLHGQIMQLKEKGWGKAKIILEVWGVTKGGPPKYKAAEAEYKRLVEESA